jgi:SAM-dependent methyltransferase
VTSLRDLVFAAGRKLPPIVRDPLRRVVARGRDYFRGRRIRGLVPVGRWERPTCSICGARDARFQLLSNGYRVVRCRRDGLLFVSPRPADLRPFYDHRYYSGGLPGSYADYQGFADQTMVPDWQARLAQLERVLGGAGRLFEVGSATGVFLDAARSRGWSVSGIDLSEWAAATARTRYGVDVKAGTLPDPEIAAAQFDAVVMWDCIEHLQRPEAVLRDCHRLIRPEGLVALSTGMIPHLRPEASRWYHAPWHLYYFSKETVAQLLASCGFELLSIGEQNLEMPEYAIMVVVARRI